MRFLRRDSTLALLLAAGLLALIAAPGRVDAATLLAAAAQTYDPDPGAIGPIDDKSYTGGGLNILKTKLQGQSKLRSDVAAYLPPQTLWTGSYSLVTGDARPLHVAGINYSTLFPGLDFSLRGYAGLSDGFGIGGRWDFSGARQKYITELRKLFDAVRPTGKDGKEKVNSEAPKLLETTMERFERAAQSWRTAAVFAFDDLNDPRWRGSAGLALTRLVSLRDPGPQSSTQRIPALTGQIRVQGFAVEQRGLDTLGGLQWDTAVFWQDAAPRLFNGGTEIARWRWRVGAELLDDTRRPGAATYGLFVVYRHEPGRRGYGASSAARNYYRRFWDFRISGGTGQNHEALVGFQVAHSF